MSNSYSVKNETKSVTGKKSEKKLTSAILQNKLYAKTDDDIAYCDFVISCYQNGTIPARVLHFAFNNALTAEQNQRFIRFQKNLEYICKHEKINLKNDKRKKTDNRANFLLFNIPKPTFLRF
ncbi:MAG: hypothetical protein LBC74_01005 [Planctomycetaceae bacterium]|nr:hypothetical protein [Planctomycetaceae bacterium]